MASSRVLRRWTSLCCADVNDDADEITVCNVLQGNWVTRPKASAAFASMQAHVTQCSEQTTDDCCANNPNESSFYSTYFRSSSDPAALSAIYGQRDIHQFLQKSTVKTTGLGSVADRHPPPSLSDEIPFRCCRGL